MLNRSRTSLTLSLLDQPNPVWSNMASPSVFNASMDCALSIHDDLGSPVSGDKFKLIMHAFVGACPWGMVLPLATIFLFVLSVDLCASPVLSVWHISTFVLRMLVMCYQHGPKWLTTYLVLLYLLLADLTRSNLLTHFMPRGARALRTGDDSGGRVA